MVATSKFIQQYQSKMNSYEHYFVETLKYQKMEDVHQLRVQIKSLRAYWVFMRQLSKPNIDLSEHFLELEKLFRIAGKLREVQVNYTTVKKLKVLYLLPYAEYLVKKEKNWADDLLVCMQKIDLENFTSINRKTINKIHQLSDEVLMQELADYMVQVYKCVINLRAQIPERDNLHKIRMKLKVVQYLYAISGGLKQDNESLKKYTQIKSLNQRIGFWHDYAVLLISLTKYSKKHKTNRGKKYMANFITRIEDKQKVRELNLLRLIDKHLNQLSS